LIRLRLRVYTGTPNREDRIGPSQDYGCSDKLYNAAADRPVAEHPKRANLAIEWPMAVQEQEIGNPIIIVSNGEMNDGRAEFAGTFRDC
jgi:hypothetical protein